MGRRDGLAGWRARFGRAAEEHAAGILRRAGLRVIARRFHCRGGEIDLVGLDGTVLVFVEVKARRRGALAKPLEAIGWRKQRRLVTAARAFMATTDVRFRGVRFDAIGLQPDARGRLRATWVRDAFRP